MSADPFEQLRSAWRDVDPPPPARALEDEDALTRAAVSWMAAAYCAANVPPASVPAALEQVTPRPSIVRTPWLAMQLTAAAAVLLVIVSVALQRAADSTGDGLPEGDGTATAVEPPDEPPVLVASMTADRIEVRSGPVRLVLLTNAGSGAGPEPAGPAPTRTHERDEPR